MLIAEVIKAIETIAPPRLQASWDNTGLQVGDRSTSCTGVLLAVDITPGVIAEAIRRGCNLVVAHHPLIFKGLKSITGDNPVQRAVADAIRAGVAVYCNHTALDSAEGGISYTMAEMLGATPVEVLDPVDPGLERVSVYTERTDAERIQMLIHEHGSGTSGSTCVSSAAESATVGFDSDSLSSLILHRPLTRIDTIMTRRERIALSDSLASGPGNISIEAVPLAPAGQARQGLGVFALLDEPTTMSGFLKRVKDTFGCHMLRHSAIADPDATVRRIACCGGSGGEFIPAAIGKGAQIYISADIRYHDFATYTDSIVVADAGHYETENCAKDIFYHILTKKFPNFAVYYSETDKNPVNYL